MRRFNKTFMAAACAAAALTACAPDTLTRIKKKNGQFDNDFPGGGNPVTGPITIDQGIVGRNIGPELEPQFRAVFPNKSIPALSYLAFKKLVRDGGIDPNFEVQNPAVKPLNDPSRSLGVSAQLNWENLVDQLCVTTTETGDENSNLLFKPDDATLLAPGERYPSDATTKKVFVAVRRAWRAPFKEDSAAIQSLRKNFLTAQTTLGNGAADRALCEAIMLSPQFWLGSGGKSEAARKVYQRLANRMPTMAEIDAYMTGKKSLVQIVKEIQTNEQAKYLDVVWRWHDWQLGFNTTLDVKYGGDETVFGISEAPNGASGSLYSHWPQGFQNFGLALHDEGDVWNSPSMNAVGVGLCNTDKDQAFDPRTAGIAFYYNGQLLASRMIRAAGPFPAGDRAGNYNGVSFSPEDFRMSLFYGHPQSPINCVNDSGTNDCAGYKFAAGTKFAQAFGGQTRDNHDSIRIVRVTPDGNLQDGSSRIKNFYGGTSRACNSFMRPALTCGGIRMPESVFNGPWLDPNFFNGLQCGKPSLADIKSTSSGYSIPNGYGLDSGAPAPSTLNDVMIGQPAIQFGGTFRDYIWTKTRPVDDLIYPYVQIQDDMNREPERFIKYIVKNNRDYRELVTGDYTIGTEYYKLFIAANGLPMGAYPPGFEKYADGGSRAALSKRYTEAEVASSVISSKDFSPISYNYVYRNGVTEAKNKGYLAFDMWWDEDKKAKDMHDYVLWRSNGQFDPRPLAGILTMPAFLQPTANKVRTYSARIFQRVLCRLPSEVVIPSGKSASHKKYIPTIEPSGSKHVDESRGCFSCHVNLDPLAAAVSSSFMTRVGASTATDMLGELFTSGGKAPGDLSAPQNGTRWGGYAARGDGMFQGKNVRGFVEVGKAVSESDEFADCAVNTAFRNLYGRDPSEEDLKVITVVKGSFKTNYKYNEMIQSLVSQPMFSAPN